MPSFLFFRVIPDWLADCEKYDLHKDVEMITTRGTIILRLSDSTPLHRDNFLQLVKKGYYDSVLFHRVIQRFMIQAGDPNSKHALAGTALGDGGPSSTIPAEIRPSLFHKGAPWRRPGRGMRKTLRRPAAAASSIIVQGKVFTPAGLDSVETYRLKAKDPSR